MTTERRRGRGFRSLVLAIYVFAIAAAGSARAGDAERHGALTLDEHGGPVKGIAIAPDGRQALTASFDYSLILWDLESGTALAHLYGHEAAVNAVAFVPGRDRAVTASDDGTLGVWDLAEHRLVTRLTGHRGRVAALALAPDGRLAASAGWDQTVRIWDLGSASAVTALDADDNLNAVRFVDRGTRIAAGSADGSLVIWRLDDLTRVATTFHPHDFAVTGLAWSERHRLLATASVDETVQVVQLPRGTIAAELFGHRGPALAVALSPDGRLVASGGVDGTVRVWRRGDGDRLRVYERHHGPVWAVAFTPDGETLLSGGADGLVVTHDVQAPTVAAPGAAPRRDTIGALGPDDVPDAGPGLRRGADLFRACAACHTVTPDGGHRAGPTLYGIFGREAGRHPGYPYSKALRESGIIWTEASIDRLFEIGPENATPGSKMPLQRMPDAADRAALVRYLKAVTTPLLEEETPR